LRGGGYTRMSDRLNFIQVVWDKEAVMYVTFHGTTKILNQAST
jgi:hypothetical protein